MASAVFTAGAAGLAVDFAQACWMGGDAMDVSSLTSRTFGVPCDSGALILIVTLAFVGAAIMAFGSLRMWPAD